LASEGSGVGFGLDFGVVHVRGAFGFADPVTRFGFDDEIGFVLAVAVVDTDVLFPRAEPFEDLGVVFEDGGEDALDVSAEFAGGEQPEVVRA
jgi:hypothetical protein